MEKKINRGVIRTGETDIKVHLIDSFPNHPYHVFDDEDMTELAASIEANGLLNPIIVRSKADGRYELISGHRRKRAYEILKINKIRAIIVDVSDDEAIIMMVDSNCQRSKILPSEKAFSYKMRLEAMKRQGARTDLTSPNISAKFRSDDELGQEVGVSGDTIRNYASLTNLVPELMQMVDEGRIKLSPAYQIAALPHNEQSLLLDTIESEQATPSLSQAQRMKRLSQNGELNEDVLLEIMMEQKKCFIQVAYLLSSEETIKREFGAFEKITDASPKYVLSLDRIDLSHDGIEHLNIVDFLLHKVQLHLS